MISTSSLTLFMPISPHRGVLKGAASRFEEGQRGTGAVLNYLHKTICQGEIEPI